MRDEASVGHLWPRAAAVHQSEVEQCRTLDWDGRPSD